MQQFSAANLLIQALSGEIYKRVSPALAYLPFALGDVVYEPGQRMNYAYFPTSAVVSLLYVMTDGATAEMGLVGNEGAPTRAVGHYETSAFVQSQTIPVPGIRSGPSSAARQSGRLLTLSFAPSPRDEFASEGPSRAPANDAPL